MAPARSADCPCPYQPEGKTSWSEKSLKSVPANACFTLQLIRLLASSQEISAVVQDPVPSRVPQSRIFQPSAPRPSRSPPWKSSLEAELSSQREGRLQLSKGHWTFRTSVIAFFMLSFGSAPTAICGLLSMGTNRMDGILWMPNMAARSCSACVSTL